MMRPLLALMAGMLCGVLGLRQSSRIRAESDRLVRWQMLLQHLRLLLQEGCSLPEAFRQAAAENTPADALLLALAQQLQHQPLVPLPQLYTPTGPEGAAIGRLLQGLAHGSLESRVLCIQQAAEEIALLAQDAQGKAQQDARMWRTLGWVCGCCLTLLLL